jgi:hypothetical protein
MAPIANPMKISYRLMRNRNPSFIEELLIMPATFRTSDAQQRQRDYCDNTSNDPPHSCVKHRLTMQIALA